VSKVFVMFVLTLLVSGCASHVQKIWGARGYSKSEIDEFRPYSSEYIRVLARGSTNSNSFDASHEIQSEKRIRAIYCSCVKKLGPRCQQRPVDLKGDDRVLWAKANGAESSLMAMAQAGNPFIDHGTIVDPVECN